MILVRLVTSWLISYIKDDKFKGRKLITSAFQCQKMFNQVKSLFDLSEQQFIKNIFSRSFQGIGHICIFVCMDVFKSSFV